MNHEAVRAYYASFAEREWSRLTNLADGMVEYAVHRHAIAQHLPPGVRVLDIGGGPGRYSLWLAERGYRVVLADLSPDLLEIGRAQVAASPARDLVEEIVEADACDLSRWSDGSFDAVLSLGPFYHLTAEDDRWRAAAELARVTRTGGIVFVAVMPRYAFMRRTLAIADERRHLGDPCFVNRLLNEGVFINDVPGRFTGGYGFRPGEVAPFFESFGFATRGLIASQGIFGDMQEILAELSQTDESIYQQAMDIVMLTADNPSILGMSNHLLYIGQKSGGRDD